MSKWAAKIAGSCLHGAVRGRSLTHYQPRTVRTGARASVEVNTIVIVSLIAPKEKIWGQLLTLNSAGVTVRGIELDSFDDFLRQIVSQEESTVGLNTMFFPMHRVERVAEDEPSGAIPSLSDRFQQKVGLTIQEYLGVVPPKI